MFLLSGNCQSTLCYRKRNFRFAKQISHHPLNSANLWVGRASCTRGEFGAVSRSDGSARAARPTCPELVRRVAGVRRALTAVLAISASRMSDLAPSTLESNPINLFVVTEASVRHACGGRVVRVAGVGGLWSYAVESTGKPMMSRSWRRGSRCIKRGGVSYWGKSRRVQLG